MAFNLITSVTPQQLSDAGQNTLAGPLSDLEAPDFTYNLYQYPLIENADYPNQGHAIIFYINIPSLSNWNTGPQNGPQPVASRGNFNASAFGLRQPTPNGANADQATGQPITGIANLVLSDKTTRTTAAISLYVPNTMVWSQNMAYENVSLSSALGIFGDLAAVPNLLEQGKYAQAGAAAASLLPDALKQIKALTGIPITAGTGARDAALAAAGIADNPQNFLLFKQIDFRKFSYEFLLTPETPQEASIINQIIYLFRFHSAPEVLTGSNGRFFIPPSEFDIDVLHNGDHNTNLPKISTCVCTRVSVDFAGTGAWSTTYDGVPLQYKLGLEFTEKSILTKDLVAQGF